MVCTKVQKQYLDIGGAFYNFLRSWLGKFHAPFTFSSDCCSAEKTLKFA